MEKVSISKLRKMPMYELTRLAETKGAVITWYRKEHPLFCIVAVPKNLTELREIEQQLVNEFILREE